jgi:serpin B
VLVSTAFYFQGTWDDPFNRARTVRAPFHAPGGDVAVRLMEQTSELPYAETGDLQVVQVPYLGGCCLTVILPGPGRQLTQVIDQLGQPGRLRALTSHASPQLVRLALPRIEIDSGAVSMRGVLEALGVTSLFTGQADLGRMTAMTPALVSDIVHRATFAVDEAGTVATAATVGLMSLAAMPRSGPLRPVEMRVDRPYLMLLQVRRDGSILFAATVTRPPSST